MKISIIHPSRSRPRQALATMQKWLSNADNPADIEYILCLDVDDPDRKRYKNPRSRILANNNISAIAAINYGAYYSTGELIIVVSDDFSCVKGWDTLLLRGIGDKRDVIVKTPDGYQKTLITLPIMDRKYYERFNYVYENGYGHLWCDTEMTVVAHMLGRVIEVPVLFEHLHYSLGKSKKDAINRKNNATWDQGKKRFYERLKNNFGIENPLVKFEDIRWH